jgi:hypothetical protein
MVDYDAFDARFGFGTVLHQVGGPIAFCNHAISLHHAKLAVYEHELIGLIKAVRYWQPYLWPRPLIVRTDHYSLKYLLDQRLSASHNTRWSSSRS